MKKATREYLAELARELALLPFHGELDGMASNLAPIVRSFPTWDLREADGLWCAAFVYYCCTQAGFDIPYRPGECKTCHLAACLGWEEFAAGDRRIEYHKGAEGFVPEAGDIVIYDRVFENKEHDHMGIVLEKREHTILAAEGNVNNRSGIVERSIDEHIRAYIRIPEGYRYQADRLILRYAAEDDLAEVARTWPSDHRPVSEAEAQGAIAYMQGNHAKNTAGCLFHLCLAVCRAEEPQTIMGWCGLDGSVSHTEPEIFILLDEEYRNQGYGTLCMKELLRIAAEDYSLKSVHGGCDKDNLASRRVMEKGGMLQVGTEENGDPLFRFTAEEGDRPCRKN